MKQIFKTSLKVAGLGIGVLVGGVLLGVGCVAIANATADYKYNHSQAYYVQQIQTRLMKLDEGDNLKVVHDFEHKLLGNAKDFKTCSDSIISEMKAVDVSIKSSNSCGDTGYIDIIKSNTEKITKACQ